jgi:hypothetical protein
VGFRFFSFAVITDHKKRVQAIRGDFTMSIKRNERGKPENSSMVKDEKEMKEQGKTMEHLATNKEVKQEGKRPDPVQHNENE